MIVMVCDVVEWYVGGCLVVVYEGGYLEVYVLFCGLVVIEEFSGVCSVVCDLLCDFIELQQFNVVFCDFQCQCFEELVVQFGLCLVQLF